MTEMTSERKQLLLEMYQLDSEHIKQRVRKEPEVVETALMLIIRDHVHNWQSNYHIGLILEEAVSSKWMKIAREYLAKEKEREVVQKT